MKILFVGDIHGQFNVFQGLVNYFTDREKIDICIQLGDYGIFEEKNYDLTKINIPVYFCDGNHDNHNILDKFQDGKIHEFGKNLYYCSFGSTLNINNKTIMFCGGAKSIDWRQRKENISWWKNEIITEEKMKNLPDKKIDIVASHTVPFSLKNDNLKSISDYDLKKCGFDISEDVSEKYLDIILKTYYPDLWIAGHWHKHYETNYSDSKKIIVLDELTRFISDIKKFSYVYEI